MGSVVRFIRLSLSPLRGIPDAWDVREIIVVAAAAVGFSGLTVFVTKTLTSVIPGIAGGIACLGLVVAILFGLAGIRLQRRVDALQVEKRIPKNRDALVAAITEFEKAELDLLVDYWIVKRLKERYPDRDVEVGPEKIEAYDAAKGNLELQERIAGAEFARRLSLYRIAAGLVVEKWRYPGEPITEEEYERSRGEIRQETAEVLCRLDDGRLYWPSSRTAPGKASPSSP
jgi:hypothetical protein